MNAKEYLDSLGIQMEPPASEKVGRLVIQADFFLVQDRGVVVSPKRGRISDRYLELLADEGVSFVLLDTQPWIRIFGRNRNTHNLSRFQALPVIEPDKFPTTVVFDSISDFIRKACPSKEAAVKIGARLLGAKIASETHGERQVFGPHLVDVNSNTGIDDILGRQEVKDKKKYKVDNPDHLLTAAAILSGYRLTPEIAEETASLMDFLCTLVDNHQHSTGLTSACSPFFVFDAPIDSEILVVTQTIGSQLLPLLQAEKGTLILPPTWSCINDLLAHLFPLAKFIVCDFFEWTPDVAPNRIVLIPPFGTYEPNNKKFKRYELPKLSKRGASRIQSEILFIEHAINIAAPEAILIFVVPEGLLANVSYSYFRTWLLERIRLLGIVSLPASICFKGASLRCSLLIAKKATKIPTDYPIFMMDTQEQDLATEKGRKAIRKTMKDMLETESEG